jgi:hypothetical protein
MSKWTGLALAALLACGLVAVPAYASKLAPPKEPGVLRVIDEAKMFSPGAVKSAESHMRSVRFDHGLTLVIDTHATIPPERKAEFDRATDDKARGEVFDAWAKSLWTGDKAEGIYVLICRHPGAVVVLTDDESRNRGFTKDNENKLRDSIRAGLKEAAAKPEAERAAARDGVLKSAVDFVVADLKGTAVTTTSDGAPLGKTTAHDSDKPGRSVGSWVCIGLCVLLGVWLVIGLIRAFSGGGGGGYGGGGFGSSLLGGLFGAMAGMWLYNSMFGGGMMGGSDAMASDGSTGAEGDTGAGDLADDTGGGGYDGGDYGGGDTGGGGDFSGGGDFGGGGGDFGGDF